MLKNIVSLVIVLGVVSCTNSTSFIEPTFAKTKISITQETMNGGVTLAKPTNKTIADSNYCKITVSLRGMIPNQMYLMEGTPAVFGYSDTSSSTGSWYFSGFILKSQLPYIKMYRYSNYTKINLTPDYPLLQHPDVVVTNKC